MTPMNVTTENHRKRLLQYQWTLADLKKDLVNWSDHYSVTVTLDAEEPGKIWMVFQKEEYGCTE